MTSAFKRFRSRAGTAFKLARAIGCSVWFEPLETRAYLASISGVVYDDVNDSGVYESNDPGLAGVTVFIDSNHTGVLESNDVSTVTNAGGSFSFTNLSNGTYDVAEVLPSGYVESSPNTTNDVDTGSGTSSIALANTTIDISAGQPQAYPTYTIEDAPGTATPDVSGSPQGFIPSQIEQAYGLNEVNFGSVTGDGAGQTIALIDAYNDPNITSDLASFDSALNISAPPSFSVLNQSGGTSLPGTDPQNGWELEESLDVEWAHALAPDANIILFEASSSSLTNLFDAVQAAKNISGVTAISMSFGSGDFSGQTSDDSIFTTPIGHDGITFLASTGDDGYYSDSNTKVVSTNYPASSPNVIAVGGTTLDADSAGDYISESGWGNGTSSNSEGGSGGGISKQELQPTYQAGVVTQSSTDRTTPDVSFDADPNTGVAVFDTYNYPANTPWVQVGGTSVASPCWASIIAIVDQGRVLAGEGTLDGPSQTLPSLYQLPSSDFRDVTSGNNGYAAGVGYDLVTGIGSPVANDLIAGLVDYTGSQAPYEGAITLSSRRPSATVDFGLVQINEPPTVASAAAANPSPVTGTSTSLSVLGSGDGGASSLTYTWSATTAPAPVSFSINADNAAQNTAVTFAAPGNYVFQVAIEGNGGLMTTSTVEVAVEDTLSSVSVSPSSATVDGDQSRQFSATGYDQFGLVIVDQPTFAWSLATGGVGGIDSAGLYVAPPTSGSATVVATSSFVSGTAAVTVIGSTVSAWAIDGGGSWSNSADWSAGIPSQPADVANFTLSLSQPSTVTLDGSYTVGSLVFNSSQPYTIAPGSGGSLTLEQESGTAEINVESGNDVIDAPLILNSNTFVSLPAAGDTLTLAGGISGTGKLTVSGPGQLIFGGGNNAVTSLAITNGATVDLGDNTLNIDYGAGSSPQATIQADIANGSLISSFVGANSSYGIGYADGADGIVAGLTAGQFVVEPALLGDADLNGSVNIHDLQIILSNFNQSGGWDEGNFTGAQTVSIDDLQLTLSNFNQSASVPDALTNASASTGSDDLAIDDDPASQPTVVSANSSDSFAALVESARPETSAELTPPALALNANPRRFFIETPVAAVVPVSTIVRGSFAIASRSVVAPAPPPFSDAVFAGPSGDDEANNWLFGGYRDPDDLVRF
jgi:SdrD B-like domain